MNTTRNLTIVALWSVAITALLVGGYYRSRIKHLNELINIHKEARAYWYQKVRDLHEDRWGISAPLGDIQMESHFPINIIQDEKGNFTPFHFLDTNWVHRYLIGGQWFQSVHITNDTYHYVRMTNE